MGKRWIGWHRSLLAKYSHASHSISSRVRVFVFILYLVAPVSLAVLLPMVFLKGNLADLFVCAGILALVVLIFVLIRGGRRRTAVAIFSFGMAGLLLVGHFTGDFVSLSRNNPLLIDRLGYLAVINIVMAALISESFLVVAALTVVYFLAGCLQLVFCQGPNFPSFDVGLLTGGLLFVLTLPLFASFIFLLQRITSQSISLVEQAKENLEEEVTERTRYLNDVMERLQVAQKSLVEGEKLAVLGRLSASIAHEVNTPLAAISASAETIRASLDQFLPRYAELLRTLPAEALRQFLALIDQADRQILVLSGTEVRRIRKAWKERLSLANIQFADELAELLADLGFVEPDPQWSPLLDLEESVAALDLAVHVVGIFRSASIIGEATTKATEYIQALRRFIFKEDNPKGKETIDLVANIETVVLLLKSELNTGITLVRNYDSRPEVRGYPDQLLQVWSNVIQNSIQAMDGKGVLTISVEPRGPMVAAEIADTGDGISPAIQDKIFDPFFTTKKIGEGTGLGLAIVKDILLQNDGSLEVESGPGNTVFRVLLPAAGPSTR